MANSPKADVTTLAPVSETDHLGNHPGEAARPSAGEFRAEKLAMLLESATQPFFGAGLDGRITCANSAFAALVGEATSSLIGRLVTEFVADPWRDAVEQVWLGRSPSRVEIELRGSKGRIIAVELAIDVDRDAHDEPAGFSVFVSDVSGRTGLVAAIRDARERSLWLYDDAPIGYHELDAEGRFVNINNTGCELLGYAREELIGRPSFDFIAESDREDAKRAYHERMTGRRRLDPFDRAVVARDGRSMVLSIEERYKRDAAGRVVGLLGTMSDVTEARQFEAALRASERRTRALFEGIDDAVFVHALDGRILDANRAATRLLGYSHDELIRMTTSDVDDPSFAAGYEDRLAQQMELGHLCCEGRHRTKDGRVIPVEISTSSIQLDEERAVLAVIRDVSERIALEGARRELASTQLENARAMAAKNAELTLSEARYRQLTEGCLDGVIAADDDGLISLFNSSAERMFGYADSDVLGRSLAVLMPKALATRPGRSFEESVRDLVGKTIEVCGRRKGGDEFPLELSLNAVARGAEPRYVVSVRDQTERHRMRALLARSEKLASIGLLSAGVAHEINNPLAYVANNLAVLERDLGSVLELVALYEGTRPKIAEQDEHGLAAIDALAEDLDWPYVRDNLPRMLARTREGVQRVATIVGNMRSLARTAPPRMEPAKLPDLVTGVLELVRVRLRRRNIALEVETGDVPPIICVPTQISQVILNLVINAVQAIEGSSRTEGGLVRIAWWLEGESVVLTVSDNGPGIDPENMPRLFDPFFTTKSVGEGTGLGLSICHGIISGHGGRIEVDSRPGEGTTFRVDLPLKPS